MYILCSEFHLDSSMFYVFCSADMVQSLTENSLTLLLPLWPLLIDLNTHNPKQVYKYTLGHFFFIKKKQSF